VKNWKNIWIFNLLFLVCFSAYSDDRDYYDVITDNNLFRPLGWTKPDTTPKFTLVATVDTYDDYSYAIIKNGRGRYTIVRKGDLINNIEVLSIESNKINMKGGKNYESNRMVFLSGTTGKKSRTTRKGNQRSGVQTSGSESGQSETAGQNQRSVQRRRSRGGSRSTQDFSGMRSQWQNASPEDRQKMIEEFRAQRGSGSRGGRRGRRQ
jgi:hypothetical protein